MLLIRMESGALHYSEEGPFFMAVCGTQGEREPVRGGGEEICDCEGSCSVWFCSVWFCSVLCSG